MSELEAPSKAEREICWNFRDAYWKCLDSNNDDKAMCITERSLYEKNCAKSWVSEYSKRSVSSYYRQVNLLYQSPCLSYSTNHRKKLMTVQKRFTFKVKHFDRRRDYLKFKVKLESGQFDTKKAA
jgi:hypothetical protein